MRFRAFSIRSAAIRSWRRNLSGQLSLILLSALSMALLCGSLMVGFSVEESLKGIGFDRLGKARYMVTPPSGVTGEMAEAFGELPGYAASLTPARAVSVSARGISLPGAFVYGVKQDFFDLYDSSVAAPAKGEVLVNRRLADRLGLKEGDDLIINLKNDPLIPVEIPLSEGDFGRLSLTLTIREILENNGPGNFSINIGSQVDDILYMNHRELSLELERPDRYSMILLEKLPDDPLDQWISERWTLEELSLYWEYGGDIRELRSTNLFIPARHLEIIESDGRGEPISSGFLTSVSGSLHDSPYSFFTSDASLEEGAVISSWLSEDSGLKVGDQALIQWWSSGENNRLEIRQREILVTEIQNDEEMVLKQDRLPSFPGLSSAASCSLWDPGVPVDMDRIRDKDEEWWNRWGASPRIILPLQVAREINRSSYGEITGIRFPVEQTASIEDRILKSVKPSEEGFNPTDLYEAIERGSREGVDFSGLFTGLNFFLILSCLYLLYQTQLMAAGRNRRDIFILQALGYGRISIYKWFMIQQSASIAVALIPGSLLAAGYQMVVLSSLNTLWSGAVAGTALSFAWNLPIMFSGLAAAFILSLVSAVWAIRGELAKTGKTVRRSFHIPIPAPVWAILFLILSISAAFWLYVDRVNQPAAFFTLGLSLLLFCFSLFHIFFLNRTKGHTDSLQKLAVGESKRKKTSLRSQFLLYALSLFLLLTLSLPFGSGSASDGGTGGYAFYAQTAMPYVADSALIDLPGLEGKAVGLRKQIGDDASCLNLNRVFQPSILGIPVDQFRDKDRFAFSDSLDKDQIWTQLATSRRDGFIPAIADATVLTWNLKVSVGDTMTIRDERGRERTLVFVAALSSSIFQGNVLIGEEYFKELFPRSGGYGVLLLKEGTDRLQAERLLRPWGVSLEGTGERLEHFARVEHNYLKIFVNLGFIALILGSLGTGLHLITRVRGDESFWSLLTALGYSERQRWIWLFFQSFPPLAWAFLSSAFSVMTPMIIWSVSGNLSLDWIWFLSVLIGLIIFMVISLFAVFRSLLKIPILRSLRNS